MDKDKRISEIDEQIMALAERANMLGNSGGTDGAIVLQTFAEINELKMEKDDLINGTHQLEINKKEKRIRQLKTLLEDARFLKRMKYQKELKEQVDELRILQEKDARLL